MKPKPPPYSKSIMQLRARGVDPDLVDVIYSASWPDRPGPDDPVIFIPAKDYTQGKYNFNFLAGLAVEVRALPRDAGAIQLLMEIGRVAAWVEIVWSVDDLEFREDISTHLIPFKYQAGYKQHWNDELERAYEARREQLQNFFIRRKINTTVAAHDPAG